MARRQRQHEHRDELRQTDQAEVQSAAAVGVDLPADCHLEHLHAHPHAEHAKPQQRKVALAECRAEAPQASARIAGRVPPLCIAPFTGAIVAGIQA
jgi:hypothetical protein